MELDYYKNLRRIVESDDYKLVRAFFTRTINNEILDIVKSGAIPATDDYLVSLGSFDATFDGLKSKIDEHIQTILDKEEKAAIEEAGEEEQINHTW